MGGSQNTMEPATQQCIHCGKQIRRHLQQCPFCREDQASIRPRPTAPQRTNSYGHFRSGLLLMLLSLAVHYFARGYSPLVLPGEVSSPMLTYLVPLLFLTGLAMSLWGVFLRVRA